jgi:hypothetical protein
MSLCHKCNNPSYHGPFTLSQRCFLSHPGHSVLRGLSSAMNTLCGQSYGAGAYEAVGVLWQRGIAIIGLATLPIIGLWMAAEPLLVRLGQEQHLAAMTAAYLRCDIGINRKILVLRWLVLSCLAGGGGGLGDVIGRDFGGGVCVECMVFVCGCGGGGGGDLGVSVADLDVFGGVSLVLLLVVEADTQAILMTSSAYTVRLCGLAANSR